MFAEIKHKEYLTLHLKNGQERLNANADRKVFNGLIGKKCIKKHPA